MSVQEFNEWMAYYYIIEHPDPTPIESDASTSEESDAEMMNAFG
jgi:hypothetical protein